MNDRIEMSNGDRGSPNLDRVLHDFFKSEMPAPWPKLALPQRLPARPGRLRFTGSFVRFAMAASLLLVFVAYWGIAGLFSMGTVGADLTPETGMIMHNPLKDRPKQPPHPLPVDNIRTPGGNDAQIFDEELPNGQAIIIIGMPSSKGPR